MRNVLERNSTLFQEGQKSADSTTFLVERDLISTSGGPIVNASITMKSMTPTILVASAVAMALKAISGASGKIYNLVIAILYQ